MASSIRLTLATLLVFMAKTILLRRVCTVTTSVVRFTLLIGRTYLLVVVLPTLVVVLMTAVVATLGKLLRPLWVGKTLAMTILLVPVSVLVNLCVKNPAWENRRGRKTM